MTFKDALLHGMTIRESATDGSDFTNPTADYRRLFLGEDGVLHVKDSSGTVTDPFPAGTGISDTIFDAKGDIIVASAADTAVRLAAGTDYQHLVARAAATNGVEWQGSAWTDYTPVLTANTTNPTLGSSTLTGRYKLLDSKTLSFFWVLTITTGGAWNPGSGQWEFSLPAGMTSAARRQLVIAHALDSGTTHFTCSASIGISATKVTEIYVADGTNPRILTNNAPVTWATGDMVEGGGIIEIA